MMHNAMLERTHHIIVNHQRLNYTNMNTPLISVIIPNYNHAIFLDERIQSVLNQTYKNFEVIILDDKSTDNSIEVINKYKDDPKVSLIVINEENSGSPFKQWLKGILLAKGELIWIAESDDVSDITFLETLEKEFEKDRRLVYSFCRSNKIDENGNVTGLHFGGMKFSESSISGVEFIQQYLLWSNCVVNASSVLFRKNDALLVDKSYQDYKGSGDWLLWILLAEKGRVVLVDNALNYAREHSSNTTTRVVLDGTSGKEARRIYDYIVDKQYIGFWTSIKYKSWKLFMSKYVMTYQSETVRKNVELLWADGWLVKMLCKLRWIKSSLIDR